MPPLLPSSPSTESSTSQPWAVDHYVHRYPAWRYGPAGKVGMNRMRIAIVFDNTVRPDTTGVYCLRALQGVSEVRHYLPSEVAQIRPGEFDLHLFIDDGLDYPIPV